MNKFFVKKGDRTPTPATLYKDGSVVDLSAATSVTFRFRIAGSGEVPVVAPCAVTGATTGKVEIQWGVGHTDTMGKYVGEFVVTMPSGVQLYPSEGFQLLEIIESLG